MDLPVMLKQIQELEFVAVDLNLYLDTHPDEQKPLADYNNVTMRLNELKREYERNYGPLMSFGCSTSDYPWRWVEEPWPWEMDY
ncbi:MAG: spore coat protein CotJB [Peptococcaceae bacterium]|nr:MAG: spore coat protein CotJB [Peptococcaceae bacterium]